MAQFTSSTIGSHASRWLFAIGLLEFLLAVGFVVGAIMIPEAAFGFFLTAGILGITGLVLILVGNRMGASAAEADRIARTGIDGQATVMGLGQTGMYLNENPQVEISMMVNVPGQPGYSATRKEFVPMILLGRLSSGQPLPVKVDPLDPSNVVIDWARAGIGGPPMGAPYGGMPMGGGMPMPMGGGMPMGAPYGGMPMPGGPSMGSMAGGPSMGSTPDASVMSSGESLAEVSQALGETGMNAAPVFSTADQGQYTVDQLRAWLRQNGTPATATITRLRDSGRTVGDERLFTMQCTLNMPGRPPQPLAESAAMVPMASASKLFVGQTVPVFVAPDNPNMLTFAWEQI